MAFTFNNRELIVNVNVEEVTTADGIATDTPVGKYRVVNLYVDTNGKLTVEYDDTPVT